MRQPSDAEGRIPNAVRQGISSYRRSGRSPRPDTCLYSRNAGEKSAEERIFGGTVVLPLEDVALDERRVDLVGEQDSLAVGIDFLDAVLLGIHPAHDRQRMGLSSFGRPRQRSRRRPAIGIVSVITVLRCRRLYAGDLRPE